MKITSIEARWLHSPIPVEQQHVSDFGRIASFDMTLVRVDTDEGLTGWGEAKAAVGSAGSCASLVALIEHDIAPVVVGHDARHISRIWETVYNGTRAGHAASRGRTHPVLGRRGHLVSAMSGVDMALWDIAGKAVDRPVVELWGGPVADELPAYASGGWADVDGIGEQLNSYVDRGFDSVKMRVGVMDGSAAASAARTLAARDALGPEIGLMVDAHGTFSGPEALHYMRLVADADLRWFEEPVSADDRDAARRVRNAATMPIAAGESEFTRFDFRDLIELGAVDVLQPDLAICGGPTEARRIGALAETHQLELAPHCWGSALSFNAGLSLAFSSPAARIIEYSLGGNPFLRELPVETITPDRDGRFAAPTEPGFGITPRDDIIDRYTRLPER